MKMLIMLLISCIHALHIIRLSPSSNNEFDVSVRFPSDVKEGDNATLTCDYNLKGKQLYSIRWYFNGQEVYRFTERPKQVKKVSPIPGITVDVSSMIEKIRQQ
jgi:hypothetical protein